MTESDVAWLASTGDKVSRLQQYIRGQWVDSAAGQVFESRSPWTGEVIATVPAGDAEDARLAVAAAHDAFGAWSQALPHERQTVFLRAAEILDARRREVTRSLAVETGCGRHFAAVQLAHHLRGADCLVD